MVVPIGAEPRTQWLAGEVALDEDGFVLTDPTLGLDASQRDPWLALGRGPLVLETVVDVLSERLGIQATHRSSGCDRGHPRGSSAEMGAAFCREEKPGRNSAVASSLAVGAPANTTLSS